MASNHRTQLICGPILVSRYMVQRYMASEGKLSSAQTATAIVLLGSKSSAWLQLLTLAQTITLVLLFGTNLILP